MLRQKQNIAQAAPFEFLPWIFLAGFTGEFQVTLIILLYCGLIMWNYRRQWNETNGRLDPTAGPLNLQKEMQEAPRPSRAALCVHPPAFKTH
jgi:hypothetical protein